MGKRLIAYFFFALGFITILFFRHYTGTLIPYPFIFWAVGILFFYGGYLVLKYSLTATQKSAQKKLHEQIRQLQVNGEKITVDLLSCEIREHNYTVSVNPDADEDSIPSMGIEDQIRTLKALSHDFRNTQTANITQSVIVFTRDNPRTGKKEKFVSRVIYKDQLSLSVHLDMQKQTTLYVDKTNRNIYYFDLSFLQ